MKIKEWSKKFLWFVLGAGTIGFLSSASTSDAQQSQLVKLIMRFGEERVLEDGTKVGVSKGEGDLIVVTLARTTSKELTGADIAGVVSSYEPTTDKIKESSSKSFGYLLNKSFKIVAVETNVNDYVSNGFTQSAVVRVKIENIDKNGNVTAGISRLGNNGLLKGTINIDGKLQLEGIIVANAGEQKTTLSATVEGKTLTNGKYLVVYSDTIKVKGAFNLSLVEDEN